MLTGVLLYSDLLGRYDAVRPLDRGGRRFAMPNLPDAGDEEPWTTPGVLRRALRFLQNRGLVTDEEFAALVTELRAVALGVANETDAQLLAIVRAALAEAFAQGLDADGSAAIMQEALGAAGFDPLRPWHARLVAQMAHANAYGFAQRQMLTDVRVHTLMPLARYHHDPSVASPRPTHLALDGFVFDPRGPLAERLRTPGGYGCMCSWEGIPAAEAATLTPDDWPEMDGVPVEVLDEGFRPSSLESTGIDSREARLRAQLTPEMLKSLPAGWKVIAVN